MIKLLTGNEFQVSPSAKKLARCKIGKDDSGTIQIVSVYHMMVRSNHQTILIDRCCEDIYCTNHTVIFY